MKFGSRDRLYADLAQLNGEQAVFNIERAQNDTVWPEYNVGSAVQHAIEAWHFASRLTPDKLAAALAGFLPRVEWHRLGELPKGDPYTGLGSAVTGDVPDDDIPF